MRACWLVLVVGLLSAPVPHAAGADSRTTSAHKAADWIAAQQESTGAFFSRDQAAEETATVLPALLAGGASKEIFDKALNYLADRGKARATRGAYTGRIIAAIVAGRGDPTAHGRFDFVAKLRSQQQSDGAYDAKFFGHLEATIGLLAAKVAVPENAIAHIKTSECSGGGFGFDAGCGDQRNVDSTALAINVLVASGRRSDPSVDRARAFLLSSQKDDGGFAYTSDLSTSSDSTGLALAAIASLKEDAQAAPWRQHDGDNPVGALLELQTESGGFKFVASGKTNGRSTTNALPGLAGLAYPVVPAAAKAAPPASATPTAKASTPPAAGPVNDAPVVVATTTPAPSLIPGQGEGPPAASASATPQVAAPFASSAAESAPDTSKTARRAAATVLGFGVVGAAYGGFRWRRRSLQR